MSEQAVADDTDLGALEPELCHRCTQHGRTTCDADSVVSVPIQTVRGMTRDEVIDYLKASYSNDLSYVTEERIANYLDRPKYVTVKYDVCDEWVMACEWCEQHYVEPDLYHDTTYSGRWGSHLDWCHSERLCRSCSEYAYICDRCGDMIHSDDSSSVEYDYIYCDSCADEATTWCNACDMRYRGSHTNCPECRDDRIHDYSYRPTPNFQWIVEVDGDLGSNARALRGVPFMGFELEVEVRDNYGDYDGALDICDAGLNGHAYYKHDGSLDSGFEIVSHPMTLAAHKTLIDWDFLAKLSAAGVRSWNTRTCGLHVHISRSAFATQKHLAMFQFLILNNKDEMTKIAGRESERWAAFDGVKGTVIPNLKGHMYRNRYEAINVLNSETLEIRMFRGSLKKQRVLMALELVNAAYNYTRNMTAGEYAKGATQFYAFAAWCMSKGDEYEHLNEFIMNKM